MPILGTLKGAIRGDSDDSRIIECRDCGGKLEQTVSSCPDCNSPNIAVYDL